MRNLRAGSVMLVLWHVCADEVVTATGGIDVIRLMNVTGTLKSVLIGRMRMKYPAWTYQNMAMVLGKI